MTQEFPKPGEEIYGFTFLRGGSISMLGAETAEFIHKDSGAQLFYIQNDDRELGFSILFRTPQTDEADSCHILEHLVLCSCPKYPSRDIFFDMDSTLIDNECIDDMAAFCGVGEQVADITRRAMEGHLPFTENLKLRVALLKGAPADVLERTIAGVRYNPGVEKFFAFLRENGIKTTIVSGGFRPIALHVAEHLGADGVLTNEVVIRDGVLTGEVTGPAGGEVLDAEGKRRALELFTAVAGDKLENAMATGDGANDLLMVKAAGFGVAYHAKAVLTEAADVAVRRGGLDTLTHLFEESWAAA